MYVPPLPKVPRYAYPPTESLPQDVQSGSAPVLAIVSVVDPNQEVQMPMWMCCVPGWGLKVVIEVDNPKFGH